MTTNSSPGDGLSWAQAFNNIQNAINTADEGDTIYLATGTFTPSASAAGIGKLIWTNKTLSVLGGYAADGGSPGALGTTPTTIYNALTYQANTNRLLYMTGVTNGTLSNIKLRGGKIGSPNPQSGIVTNYYGAGIYMANCTNITLNTIVFDSNEIAGMQAYTARGAGLYATNSWGSITNSIFKNGWMNRVYGTTVCGVGLALEGGSWSLRDCVIRDNTTANNTASGDGLAYGVGIYLNEGSHSLLNCVITRNYARSFTAPQGEALCLAAGTTIAENCTFYWHRFSGVRRNAGSLTLKNSILWECGDDIVGTMTLQNCDIQDGDSNGVANCFSSDPLFERGIYLATNSPCIDAGNTNAAEVGLSGQTTKADGVADSGLVDLGYHFPAGITDLFVSVSTGSDSNAGTNAATAFKTISKACSVARDGTHINVAAGTYTSSTETFPLSLANLYGVQVLGAHATQTVINAAGANARVLGLSYIYPDARVDGVKLTGANWRLNGGQGGGLFVEHSRGTLSASSMIGNQIQTPGGNWGPEQGGGLYMSFSWFTVSNCTISGNTSGPSPYPESAYGGGIAWDSSDGLLDSCIITNNRCVPNAGNSVYNTTRGFGGGLYMSSDGLGITARNCLIASNKAENGYTTGLGGGLYCASACSLVNCTLVTNWSHGVYGGTTASLLNCIVWNNGLDVAGAVGASYSDIGTGTYTDGGHNLSVAPSFATNPVSYRILKPGAGWNGGLYQAWMANALDLDGQPRNIGPAPDMGCYEVQPELNGTVFSLR